MIVNVVTTSSPTNPAEDSVFVISNGFAVTVAPVKGRTARELPVPILSGKAVEPIV